MIIMIMVVESFERPFELVLTSNKQVDVQLIKDYFLFLSSRMKARFLFSSACFKKSQDRPILKCKKKYV